MITYLQPLKRDQLFALDSGQVEHFATHLVLVWDRGSVIRWGYTSACYRWVESRRLTYFRRAYRRRYCRACQCQRSKEYYQRIRKQRHRYTGDEFYRLSRLFRMEGVGVWTGR